MVISEKGLDGKIEALRVDPFSLDKVLLFSNPFSEELFQTMRIRLSEKHAREIVKCCPQF